MNDERTECKHRLLNEVLGEDSFQGFNAELKQRALTEFRRGRLVRRLASISSLAAALLAMAVGGFFFHAYVSSSDSDRQPDATANYSQGQATLGRPKESATIPTLTDEELIASFPPNSCFLAEVEGRKVLVFRDPALRKLYLR